MIHPSANYKTWSNIDSANKTMPLITYINANNDKTAIDVPTGMTVMYGASINMIDGILAECGGALTCATCHCYVHPDWLDVTGTASDKENQTLSKVRQRKVNSRLSCQLKVEEKLDGLIVYLPESQLWSDDQ